jgi:membrane-associated phospholipid phosphatase
MLSKTSLRAANSVSSRRLIWALAAVAAFALFLWLGRFVTTNGEPPGFWAGELPLLNHSTLVAWWLTWACYPKVLIPICLVLLVVAWRFPAWRGRVLLSVVLLLLSWRGADFFQHFFARPRRLDWVVRHETSFSYPSSHAAIVTGFYALWAMLLYLSDLPSSVRRLSVLLLLLFSAAVCWSRLALGAHYLTDIAGGILLGIAFVSGAAALVPAGFFRGVAGRLSSSAE